MHGPITEQLKRMADALDASAHDKSLVLLFGLLERKLDKIMASLDRLTATVEKFTTVQASVLALIAGLSQQIKDAGVDQVKLDALTDKLDADAQGLVDAVTANTPPAPPVPVVPVEVPPAPVA